MIAAANVESAELAGKIGDGLISTIPNDLIVRKFRASDGSAEKPCFGQMTVCWAETEEKAKNIATEFWPVSAVPGKLMSELATPAAFEATVKLIDAKNIGANVVCGPDPEKYLEKIRSFADAGFDHVYIHQVGPNQEGFFDFYERDLASRHI
jgi:coenzyme F420-dependent glucose-6-phosphate dehydrogenase